MTKEKPCKDWHDVPSDEMTLEQARQAVKDLRKKLAEYLWQTPCDDAISRQAAIRWVKTECNPYGKPTLDFESGKKVIEYLKRMSPITPQPKIGHWIIIDDCEQFIAKCSECGRIVDSRMLSKYPYCHCGTKMIKPQ